MGIIILDFLHITCLLALIYILYQMLRNNEVYSIRIDWIITNDKRFDKYSYDEMFNPSKKNYYGLRYPRDKHFNK